MSGWQPIETAPKDTAVLIVGRSRNIWMASYRYVGPRAGSRWQSFGLGAVPFTPTHWHSLPDPPNLHSMKPEDWKDD